MPFERFLPDAMVEALNQLELMPKSWWSSLVNSHADEVFIGARRGTLNVYVGGGSLLKIGYRGGKLTCTTHEEYLVLRSKRPYINLLNGPVASCKSIQGPEAVVERLEAIRRRIKAFSGLERQGVNSIARRVPEVIDIEITDDQTDVDPVDLSKPKSKRGSIDIAAVDHEGQLWLYEAKLLCNSELRAKARPKIADQLSRYERWISQNATTIVSSYNNNIEIFGRLKGSYFRQRQYPKISRLRPRPVLLVFGFTDPQIKHELIPTLRHVASYYLPLEVRRVGNANSITSTNIFTTELFPK